MISGEDRRGTPRRFVNQLFMASVGGPASPVSDGWIGYGKPAGAGLLYSDSVEIDEQKYPIVFDEVRLLEDSGGAGTFRGGPASRVTFGPSSGPVRVVYSADGALTAPLGAAGGEATIEREVWLTDAAGERVEVPLYGEVDLQPGETISDVCNGGGGYGPPAERDPERVRRDVAAGYVSPERARDTYRVALAADGAGGWRVDAEATAALREAGRG